MLFTDGRLWSVSVVIFVATHLHCPPVSSGGASSYIWDQFFAISATHCRFVRSRFRPKLRRPIGNIMNARLAVSRCQAWLWWRLSNITSRVDGLKTLCVETDVETTTEVSFHRPWAGNIKFSPKEGKIDVNFVDKTIHSYISDSLNTPIYKCMYSVTVHHR